MYPEKAKIIFPEENDYRMNEELFWRITKTLKFRGFEGVKRTLWFLVILFKGLVVLGTLIFAYKVKNDPNKLAACVATCPAILMAVLKMIYMHFQPDRVKYLLDTVQEEFWDMNISGPRIRKHVSTRFFIVNLILLNQLIVSMNCIFLLNMYPLIEMPEGVKRLPNALWTPFDTNPSPLHEVLYVYLVCNQIITFVGNAFYDFTYIYAIQHLCVQLALLKELLRNLSIDIMPHATDLEKFNSKYFQTAVMKRLNICINHHCKLLKYGKQIDKFTSTVLIPQLIMSYMTLVINGYILTADQAVSFQSFELSSFTLIMFSELVVLAVQASDLKEQSISVIDAVWSSEWYLFKAPIKRALVCLMLNSKKGVLITVGGMINVDNPLIITILQKAFSAITLLKALIMEAEIRQK